MFNFLLFCLIRQIIAREQFMSLPRKLIQEHGWEQGGEREGEAPTDKYTASHWAGDSRLFGWITVLLSSTTGNWSTTRQKLRDNVLWQYNRKTSKVDSITHIITSNNTNIYWRQSKTLKEESHLTRVFKSDIFGCCGYDGNFGGDWYGRAHSI